MKILYCSDCTFLKSISNIEGLELLYCEECISLTSIPNIGGLNELHCQKCTSLTFIPNIEGLLELDCDGCRLLTSLPNFNNLRELDYFDCPWIEPDEERMDNLIKLQQWFDRYLRRKKLEKLIHLVNCYWFSPDGPGGKGAIRRLNEMVKNN